jgi:hypothetical protein
MLAGFMLQDESIGLGSTAGTLTQAFGMFLGAATYTAGAARTISTPVGLYVAAPIASTNVTFGSGPYAIYADNLGVSFFGGPVSTGRPREWWAQANTAAATMSTVGNAVTPTLTSGTAATSQRNARGDWARISTTTTNGNIASVLWAAFTHTRMDWDPIFRAVVEIPTITSLRVHVGLYSATPGAADSIATVSGLGFRFSTGASDTKWVALSSNGTTQTVAPALGGSPTVAANTRYELVIDARDIANVRFYVNDTLIATATATIPAAATDLGMGATVATLTTAQRDLDVGLMRLEDAA